MLPFWKKTNQKIGLLFYVVLGLAFNKDITCWIIDCHKWDNWLIDALTKEFIIFFRDSFLDWLIIDGSIDWLFLDQLSTNKQTNKQSNLQTCTVKSICVIVRSLWTSWNEVYHIHGDYNSEAIQKYITII